MSETLNYKAPRWAWWIATGFGSGRLRPAPGTWGSLAGLLAWVGLVFLIRCLPKIFFECTLGILTLLVVFVSIIAAGLVVRQIGVKDPSYIVSDEWAGMWLALWPARYCVVKALEGGNWVIALALMFVAFLFFRLFDIWKPCPVRKIESLPGGWGITMDDVMTGVFAGLLVYCVVFFLVLCF